jgi:hypothetical protein
MTISSTVSRLSYSGNSSTTAFSVSFKFIDAADLVVYLDDTLQTLTTDYSVTGGSGSTGTVTFVAAPATGKTVTIVRDVALLQETDYVDNDPFPAETHERALDRLTMIAQRNRDLIDRSLTLSDSSPVGVSTQLPTPAANEVIAWNFNGTALTSKTVAELSNAVIGANTVVDTFSGTGAQVSFTMSADPQTENNTLVFVGGVYQEKTEYSIAGDIITFSVAPPSGVNVQVIQQVSVTYPITSLTDGVVTTSKISDGSVTSAKIASSYDSTLLKTSAIGTTVHGYDAQLFSNIPQNSKSAAYTLVSTDAQKHIFHPSADTTARTFTIPANSSVAYPIGTALTFINQNGAGVVTIAITTDTMRLAGAGTTGSRTLAANGVATAIKVTSTEWIISGTGLS